MNSCDMGLNLEHCLQLCRQVGRLQVRDSEGGDDVSPVGKSDGLQSLERFRFSFALLGRT